MDRKTTTVLLAVALVALVVGAIGLRGVLTARDSNAEPASQPAVVNGPQSRFEGAELPPNVRAPDFSLRDENGRRVTMREYRGRPVVVTFLYAHCHEECPVQAQQIKGALDDLGHDLPALSVSVDPSGDTPRAIKHFNRKQGVSGRLRWVRGTKAQLRKLWKGFAIIPQSPEQEHMARTVLIDKDGMQRVGFPASQTTPERLAHDLRVLERERG